MRTRSGIFKLLLVAVFLATVAFVPKDEGIVDRLTNALQQWMDHNPQEKVYLHTDRPYYAVGDTIWFKAYVTIGPQHQLSAQSGALYVELVNSSDSVTVSLKLPVVAGMAKGSFVLPDEYLEGNYRLRSYTRWMRNAGPDYYFDRPLLVKNHPYDFVFTNITYSYQGAGAKRYLSATLNYTDSIGRPLTDMRVKYNLRKNYNTIFSGNGVTDKHGNLKVDLKDLNTSDIKESSLITRAELGLNDIVTKSFPIKSIAMASDVQFFPEGGDMVAGFESRIGFKAIATDATGTDIKGVVIDEQDKEVVRLASTHLGMGKFSFTPEVGHSYRAKVSFADGSERIVSLPAVKKVGYVLAAEPNLLKDSVTVRIRGNRAQMEGNRPMHLIMQSGGEVYYSASINVFKAENVLHLPLADMPSGIAQLTLFSDTGDPLNERIFFVDNADRISLKIPTLKAVYNKRERATLRIFADAGDRDAGTGNFSVSVINEDEVPFDDEKATTIYSQLLLNSDIKGYIEKPNYYFERPTAQTREDLDLLMLTQGYRRFNWSDISAGKLPYHLFKPEGLTTAITGKLVGQWGFKVPYGKLYVYNGKYGFWTDTVTDKNGNFNIDKLVLTDGLRFKVAGRKKSGASTLRLHLDKDSQQQLTFNNGPGDMVTDLRSNRAIVDIGKGIVPPPVTVLPKGKLLKTVNIKTDRPTMGQMFKPQINRSVLFNDSDSGKTVAQAIIAKNIKGLLMVKEHANVGTAWKAYMNNRPMMILQNDKAWRPDEINDILNMRAEDVIKIDMATNTDSKTSRPVMLIYMRVQYFSDWYPWFPDHVASLVTDIVDISFKGFDKMKEFYQPKYDQPLLAAAKPDLRTTVHWEPSLITREGRATLSYYNNDKPGNYKVTIEGINSDGLLARQVFRYKVQ